jgi:hypothetical protein
MEIYYVVQSGKTLLSSASGSSTAPEKMLLTGSDEDADTGAMQTAVM